MLVVSEEDRRALERLSRRRKTAQAIALRARIVLARAEDVQSTNGEAAATPAAPIG